MARIWISIKIRIWISIKWLESGSISKGWDPDPYQKLGSGSVSKDWVLDLHQKARVRIECLGSGSASNGSDTNPYEMGRILIRIKRHIY